MRIIQHDAVEVLCHMIAPDTLDGVHVFFPDPWPKKRHHKRRLMQPAFVALLSRAHETWRLPARRDRLAGIRRADSRRAASEPQLNNTALDYAPRPDYRPQTKFETRGLKLGHGVWDVIFKRR